jgi:hypothetical protein
MRLKKLSPKSRPLSPLLKAALISLFSDPGQWSDLVNPQECLTPQGDTLRSSIMLAFPIRGHNTSTILLGKLDRWLARCGGLTPDRVPRIKPYVTCLLSKEAHNPAAIEGQQWMKKVSRLVYKGSMACVSRRRRPNTASPKDLVRRRYIVGEEDQTSSNIKVQVSNR